MLGSQHHERDAEDGIGTRRKNFQLSVQSFQAEKHLGSFAPADPVALYLFERFTPLQAVEAVQHPLCISRHTQQPLLHQLLFDRKTAAHRKPVFHLVIGQYGSEPRTPVDQCVGPERQPVVLQHVLLFGLAHRIPFGSGEGELLRAGNVQAIGTALFERSDQFGNGARLLFVVAIVTIEHFEECPLRPLVIFGIAGTHLAVPIETEADFIELFAVTVDILLRSYGRMLAGLDRILLGRQPERIVTHRMQHIETPEPFVTRIDVRCDVTQRMTDVQSRPRRIREHVQHIIFRPALIHFDPVGFLLGPTALPFLLYSPEIVLHIVNLVFVSLRSCPGDFIPFRNGYTAQSVSGPSAVSACSVTLPSIGLVRRSAPASRIARRIPGASYPHISLSWATVPCATNRSSTPNIVIRQGVAVTVHKCQDSRTYSAVYDSVLHSDHPAEFPADAVQQSFIQRFGKTKIGMQHRNSFTGRLLRRPRRIVTCRADGQQCQVFTLSQYTAPAEREGLHRAAPIPRHTVTARIANHKGPSPEAAVNIRLRSSTSSIGEAIVNPGTGSIAARSKTPWCVAPSSPTSPARSRHITTCNPCRATS